MSKKYPRPSYELICQAVNGNEMAIKEVLDFYDSYISKLSQRPIVCESGKVSMIVDVGNIQVWFFKSKITMWKGSDAFLC